jgi:hypothetical protein
MKNEFVPHTALFIREKQQHLKFKCPAYALAA